MVSMDMRVDDMGDAHAGLLCLFNEPFLVTGDNIDRCGETVTRTAEKI
jgi:hypothetical protein